VTGIQASTNNRAKTVLDVFLEAIREYGVSSRLWGDRGGENVAASVWMIMHQGPNMASFMCYLQHKHTHEVYKGPQGTPRSNVCGWRSELSLSDSGMHSSLDFDDSTC
jgi:hypothetical protein